MKMAFVINTNNNNDRPVNGLTKRINKICCNNSGSVKYIVTPHFKTLQYLRANRPAL